MGLLRKIRDTGRVAEPAPPRPEGVLPQAREFGGSVQVRCVDAGSCNGCEIEIAAAFNPVYDAERYGARLVASPRHADVALVTGPVTRNMAEPLRRTVAAMPEPRLGACGVLSVGGGGRRGMRRSRAGRGLAAVSGAAAQRQ
jgi:ferredoxin